MINLSKEMISLFVGQQGFFGIATDLTLKLTKAAKQKFFYKIKVDENHSQSDILTLIQKMRELYSHDINGIEMNVTKNGSQIVIDSNQSVSFKFFPPLLIYFKIPSMLEQEGIELNENVEEYKPRPSSAERNRKMFLRIPANKASEMYFGLQDLLQNSFNIKDYLMKIELVNFCYLESSKLINL